MDGLTGLLFLELLISSRWKGLVRTEAEGDNKSYTCHVWLA
jgi:hypothetical protein